MTSHNDVICNHVVLNIHQNMEKIVFKGALCSFGKAIN